MWLERLILSHTGLMLGVAARYAPSREDREDIVQSAALALLRRADTIAGLPEAAQRAYICSAVRSCGIDLLRKRGQYHVTDADDELPADESVQPEIQLQRMQERHSIREAYSRLCEADQEVIRLRCFEHLGAEETGSQLGISADSVRSRLSRPRRRLRLILEEEGIDL